MINDFNVIIDTFIDLPILKKIKLPLIVVYEKPLDFPNKYVARLFNMDKPTQYIVIKDTLEEIRKSISINMSKIEPSRNDDKVIKEIWL